MTDRTKMTWAEWVEAPVPKTIIAKMIDNEPIEFEVDFVVREETAEQRAHRRWGMKEQE